MPEGRPRLDKRDSFFFGARGSLGRAVLARGCRGDEIGGGKMHYASGSMLLAGGKVSGCTGKIFWLVEGVSSFSPCLERWGDALFLRALGLDDDGQEKDRVGFSGLGLREICFFWRGVFGLDRIFGFELGVFGFLAFQVLLLREVFWGSSCPPCSFHMGALGLRLGQ